jgi:CheY-like chemotaxis protein/anti-sigma regulatory factor (Ser/Thr protein kinase)
LLVDDLLDVSRISHAKIAIKREPVAVSTFVRTAVEANLVLLENAQQELKVILPEQELWIDGDEARLAQIVGNLLHNASKFTHAGGRVEFSAFADGDEVVLRISDTGIGIAANRLEYIFGMFAQAEHAEDKGREGLGIGLSLVKTLVELHGGTVIAGSAGSGKGSAFEVRLPGYRQLPATAPQVPAAEPSPAAMAGKKILVVDDVADGADTLSELLQMMGHEVRTAYSGKQAIEAAGEFIPDAVFLDIGLQDMSGYEVAATLRGMEHVRHSYLIALTGFGQEQDRLQAFAAGFDEHIVKPVDFEVISNLTFEH